MTKRRIYKKPKDGGPILIIKQCSLETLAQRFDIRLFGRGKRVFARLDSEDDSWYHFTLSYCNENHPTFVTKYKHFVAILAQYLS